MENINDHKGGIRKFSVSPRLAKLKADFEASGGKFENWKLEKLFDIQSNPQLNKDSFVFSETATYPYFTRTVFNNGILGNVEYLDKEHLIHGNSIAVGMIGMQFFYMNHDFYAGQFTKTIFPKFDEFNEKIALFFISLLNKFQSKFLGVLVRDFEKTFYDSELSLPTRNGIISFDYMEQYISLLEEEKMLQVDKFLKDSGLNETTLTVEEANALEKFRKGEVKFREWKIGELFEKHELKIINPNFNKKTDLSSHCDKEHSIPVTNAKLGDNGIMFWGKPNDFKTQSMSIDIVQNGAVATGKVYPQPQQTGVLWDSYLIGLTNHTATNELLFFFSTVLEKSIRKKYYYENKAYWKLVREDEIVVPVTICGTVDYAFMHHFISALEKLIMRSVVEMVEKKPEEYQHGYSVTCMTAEASHYEGL